MTNILKIIFLFSISLNLLFAQEDIKSKELYLSYSSYPKRVFTGQKFNIKLQAIILKSNNQYDKVVTTFTVEENIDILTKDIIWNKDKTGKYFTTITYKALKKQFILPTITLALVKDENIIEYISVKSPKIKYEKIAVNQKLFSNIIAQNLEIRTAKTKQYTNNILHTTIHIEARNSNLEDIKLNQYKEQGIKSLTQDDEVQKLYYYVMIPSHKKQINFTYYNTKIKNFIMVNIPIILDEELVSTQTELNPYNSSILIYKQIFSGGLLLFFMLIYIFTKKDRYIVLIVIFILILAYLFIPNKKILLEKNINIYILPTKNSTVYKILDSRKIVEIINKKAGFVKVLFKNENIGWVKENDIK
jgi:hypothetical protein